MNTEELIIPILCKEICNIEVSQNVLDEINVPGTVKRLYEISNKHELAHLVSDFLFKINLLPKDEIGESFQKQQLIALYQRTQMTHELQCIINVFSEANVDFIPLKGAVLCNYYPEAWMRTSCDIDILVHAEDVDRACSALENTEKYNIGKRSSHDVHISNLDDTVNIELHFDLMTEDRANRAYDLLKDVWEHSYPSEKNKNLFVMENEMFYAYHIAHMASHFETGGCGIRPFLDLWLMNKSIQFDRKKQIEYLRKMQLEKFAECSEELSKRWFSGEDAGDLEKFAHYVFAGGIYGNVKNAAITGISQSDGKIKFFAKRLFPSFKTIAGSNTKKHKILLPYYWVRRWFNVLFHGRMQKNMQMLKKGLSQTDSSLNENREMLKKLGLK